MAIKDDGNQVEERADYQDPEILTVETARSLISALGVETLVYSYKGVVILKCFSSCERCQQSSSIEES